MFQAIIFDMDGLMIDTEPMYWEVGRGIAKKYGAVCTDETFRKMMGRERLQAMKIFAEQCGISAATPQQLLDEREVLMVKRFAAGVEPMAGLHEMLEKFQGRLKFAVATSSPKKFTDVLLPALGLDRYFDVIQSADDIVHGKPEPEIYLKAAARLGVEPGNCFVLEDSPAGALAGHRAGAYVIAVPSPLTSGEDFSFAGARASNLHEAAAIIEKLIAIPSPGGRGRNAPRNPRS
jgi:HAD superfamily hydrolase (TIGR01509 family)